MSTKFELLTTYCFDKIYRGDNVAFGKAERLQNVLFSWLAILLITTEIPAPAIIVADLRRTQIKKMKSESISHSAVISHFKVIKFLLVNVLYC